MAKSSIEAYGAESEYKGLVMDPANVTIVGIDCPDDICPELADPERKHLHTNLDQAMVDSIKLHGVKVPVTIRKVGEYVCAEDGRRRILHAREANKQLKKEGNDHNVLIRCVIAVKGTDALEGLILANEYHAENGPVAKAQYAQRLRERGRSEEQIALTMGVSKQTLRNWSALIDLPNKVQRKVADGSIPMSTAIELVKLDPTARDERVEELLKAATNGQAKGTNGKAIARGEKNANGEAPAPKARMMTRASLQEWWNRVEPTTEEPITDPELRLTAAILAVVVGQDPTGKGLKEWPEVRKVAKAVLRSDKADK